MGRVQTGVAGARQHAAAGPAARHVLVQPVAIYDQKFKISTILIQD